jgi:hypothetical protein
MASLLFSFDRNQAARFTVFKIQNPVSDVPTGF